MGSVEEGVASGALPAGSAMPSVRKLAAELGVSPGTVAAAVAELRRRGLVVSRPRSGLRIAERPPVAAPHAAVVVPEGVRDLANGNPDPRLLPRLSIPGGLGPRLYGETPLLPELAAAAAVSLRADGVDASHLCAVSGALDGVERILQAHLESGDSVVVEDPGFSAVLDLVRALGLVPVAVEVDEAGMRPEALRSALAGGARAVVLTPRGQNPMGSALDPARARELRKVLDPFEDVLVVEDDHLGPVAGAPLLTLTKGRRRWAVVRSASKWLGPDLRLAIVAADERSARRVEGRHSVGPGWVSTILQRMAAAMWADPDVVALGEQAATVYAGRRKALIDALATRGVGAVGRSGLNVWIPVDDEDGAVRALLGAGWAVTAGSRFRAGASAPGVRVTIASLSPRDVGALADAVAAAVRPAARTRSG